LLSLHLLRHGETDFSRQDRFCGAIDAELTEDGDRMAEAFAARYDNPSHRWRAIYTSTRRRTIATAAPLARRTGLEPRREAGLDEISQGDWQGRSKAEIARTDPAGFRRWLDDPTDGAPSGESVAEVAARALEVVGRIRWHYRNGHVLVVAHKTVLRVLIRALLGIELSHYRHRIAQPVGSHTVFDLARGANQLRLLADLSHLPAPLHRLALATNVHSPFLRPEAPKARATTDARPRARTSAASPRGSYARCPAFRPL